MALEKAEGNAEAGAVQADQAKTGEIVHKARKQKQRPAWKPSDIRIAATLAALTLPAWVLPESAWAPLWRARMRIPLMSSRRAVKRTAKSVRAALGDVDVARSEAIIRDLKAAVHELTMEDLRAWRPGGWQPERALEGEEYLKQALSSGKGAVLWVAPFVFYSAVTKIVLNELGYRCSHLSSPKHGFSETQFGIDVLNRIRCIPEDKHLVARIVFDRKAPTTAMRRMMRALKAGEVVSIVASSTEGYDMIQAPVFGGRLPVAVGAPRLAGLTGAPLLPLFTVRDGGRFRIVIEQPIAVPRELGTEERCIAAAAEFLRRSEPWVRKFPEQWRAWSKWKLG